MQLMVTSWPVVSFGRLQAQSNPAYGERRMIFLSDQDVEDLLDPVELMAALALGFARLSHGTIDEPASVRMNGLGAGSGYLTLFPAHDAVTRLATAKVLFGDPARRHVGKPEIDAVVAIADTITGEIVALVEARSMTALRTAATTALAIQELSRLSGQKLPEVIGLIGTGRQTEAHARVLAATGLASSFVVASAAGDIARTQALARQISTTTGLNAKPLRSPEAVADAPIIVTASLSDLPVFSKSLRPDQLLACIGPFLPHSHEIEPGLLADAALIVSDHPDRLRQQWAGNPMVANLAPERLVPLADILGGEFPAIASGHCVFLSDGRGFEDNVAAGLVLAAARRLNRGRVLR